MKNWQFFYIMGALLNLTVGHNVGQPEKQGVLVALAVLCFVIGVVEQLRKK